MRCFILEYLVVLTDHEVNINKDQKILLQINSDSELNSTDSEETFKLKFIPLLIRNSYISVDHERVFGLGNTMLPFTNDVLFEHGLSLSSEFTPEIYEGTKDELFDKFWLLKIIEKVKICNEEARCGFIESELTKMIDFKSNGLTDTFEIMHKHYKNFNWVCIAELLESKPQREMPEMIQKWLEMHPNVEYIELKTSKFSQQKLRQICEILIKIQDLNRTREKKGKVVGIKMGYFGGGCSISWSKKHSFLFYRGQEGNYLVKYANSAFEKISKRNFKSVKGKYLISQEFDALNLIYPEVIPISNQFIEQLEKYGIHNENINIKLHDWIIMENRNFDFVHLINYDKAIPLNPKLIRWVDVIIYTEHKMLKEHVLKFLKSGDQISSVEIIVSTRGKVPYDKYSSLLSLSPKTFKITGGEETEKFRILRGHLPPVFDEICQFPQFLTQVFSTDSLKFGKLGKLTFSRLDQERKMAILESLNGEDIQMRLKEMADGKEEFESNLPFFSD